MGKQLFGPRKRKEKVRHENNKYSGDDTLYTQNFKAMPNYVTLTVEETLHKLQFCWRANSMASRVLLVTTTSCIPAKHSPPVSHSNCIETEKYDAAGHDNNPRSTLFSTTPVF